MSNEPTSPKAAAPGKDLLKSMKDKADLGAKKSNNASRNYMKALRDPDGGPITPYQAKKLSGKLFYDPNTVPDSSDDEEVLDIVQEDEAEPAPLLPVPVAPALTCVRSPSVSVCALPEMKPEPIIVEKIVHIQLESPGIEPAKEEPHLADCSQLHPLLWTVDDVLIWMQRTFSFGHLYVDSFQKHQVDGATLLEVADVDLRTHLAMEPQMHRARVMASLCQLATRPHWDWQPNQCQGWIRSSFAFGPQYAKLPFDGESLLAVTDKELKSMGVIDDLHREALLAKIGRCRFILGMEAVSPLPPMSEQKDFWDDIKTQVLAGVVCFQLILVLVLIIMVAVL